MNQIDIPLFKAQLLDELRCELDTATETPTAVVELDKHRPPRHQSRLVKVAAAAVVLAGAGAIAIGGFSDSPAFSLSESADGVITVTWDDGFDDGPAIEKSLRDAGVNISVNFLNASPSLVGQLFSISPTDPDVLATGFTYDDNAMVIDTTQVTGEYTINIGIESDGPYDAFGSAFDHDEILDGLACVVPNPMRVSDIAPFVADESLEVVWHLNRVVDAPAIGDPGPDEVGDYIPFGLQSETVESAPAGLVLSARSPEPGTLTIEVLAEGESPDQARAFFENPTDPCTPDRAARWNQ